MGKETSPMGEGDNTTKMSQLEISMPAIDDQHQRSLPAKSPLPPSEPVRAQPQVKAPPKNPVVVAATAVGSGDSNGRAQKNPAKKAPAFIRGGRKPVIRTRSLPLSNAKKAAAAAAAASKGQPALSPVRTRQRSRRQLNNQSPKQQQQQQQQPQLSPTQQRREEHRERVQRTASAKMQRRRSSMGGAAALARVSRRVSIGNELVGVTQTTWGQKPIRRSSLNPNGQKQKQQQQIQQQQQQQQQQIQQTSSIGGGGGGGKLSPTTASNYHYADYSQLHAPLPNQSSADDLNDSCSRRSSLSSHGSDFSDYDEGGAYLTNVTSMVGGGSGSGSNKQTSGKHRTTTAQRRLSNDSDDNYSYANDSLDLRNKKMKAKVLSGKGRRTQKPTPQYLDDDDSLGDDDTYAADSLDLRKYRNQKQANREEDDDDDYFDDSIGDDDTYAADSLDLRRTSKMRQQSAQPVTSASGNARNAASDDSAAGSAYSCANDSLDLRKFRKKKFKQQQEHKEVQAEDLGYGKADPSRQDLGYDEAPDLGYDLGYGTATPQPRNNEVDGGDEDDQDEDDASSYDAYSYAADSLNLRSKFCKPGVTTRTATTTEGDDDDSDDFNDDSDTSTDAGADSNKTPIDYMTRIVMGYSKKNGNGETEASAARGEDSDSDGESEDDYDSAKTPVDYMTRIVMGYSKNQEPIKKPAATTSARGETMRRMSIESTASSVYSYACDSVAMGHVHASSKKAAPLALSSLGKKSGYASKEGYDDDDCSDYSDDESHHGGGGGGNNPYLSAMLGYGSQSKSKPIVSETFDAGVARRMSCDSYANDSVFKPKGQTRRASVDSLVSGISTNELDPQYLHDVLGYAMDASAGESAEKTASANPSDPRDFLVSATYTNMMESMTSIGSEGDWALSPSHQPKGKANMPIAAKSMQLSAGSLGSLGSLGTFGSENTSEHS